MRTRKEYMAGLVSHREYYGQFVTDRTIGIVSNFIGVERIKASVDIHLNDIPLAEWDILPWSPGTMREVATANGTGGVSLSDKVCVMKEAARQIRGPI